MKHPITKQIDEQLRLLAAKLPKLTKLNYSGKEIRRPHLVNTTGAQLLAANPKAKDKHGKPINPNTTYSELRKIYVDHYRELRGVYLIAGQEGIEQYVLQINARYRDVIRKYNQPHKVIGRLIKRLFSSKKTK